MMRRLMALPLLPAAHVEPVFRELQQPYADDSSAVADLLQYMEQTWIVNSMWSPATISVFQQQVRTNNDLEGWHRRLNNVARRANVPFYLLVRLLHSEAQTVTLQLHLLSDGLVLRRTSKRYTKLNARLTSLWAEYTAGQKTATAFLRAAAHLQLRNFE